MRRTKRRVLPPPSTFAQCAYETSFRSPQTLRCSSHPATLLRAETHYFSRGWQLKLSPSNFAREPATCPLLATPRAAPSLSLNSYTNNGGLSTCERTQGNHGYGLAIAHGLRFRPAQSSRTNTRDNFAGTAPLPRALADGHARCSRTSFRWRSPFRRERSRTARHPCSP